MKSSPLRDWTMRALLALLVFGILTLWVRDFWPWALFQLGVFALGFTWSLALIRAQHQVRLPFALAPLAAATVWPFFQLMAGQTIYRWNTWSSFWLWTVNWTVLFLASQIGSEPGCLRSYLKALMYFAGLISILAILQTFTSGGKIFWLFPSGFDDFVLGPFVYQNQFAAFIELILPIALYFYLADKNNRSIAAAIAAVMIASVVASASRAGTFLVLVEIFVVPVLAIRAKIISRQHGIAELGKIAALAAAGALIVGYGAVWRRLFVPDLLAIRREMWTAALHMIRDRPVMGFGLGTWQSAYPQYALFDPSRLVNQAHSDWLQWGVEGGVPFLILMLMVGILLARGAVRSIWGLGVVFFMLHALVDYPFQQRPVLSALFFAVAGAVDQIPRRDRSQAE